MTSELTFTLAGFALACAGVWINWGAGWACLSGGLVIFIAGGLASREQRRS